MDRVADNKLVDLDQFLLLVVLQLVLSLVELLVEIVDFFMGLVSLLLKF